MKRILYISIVSLMVVSCSIPLNKDSYIKKFDAFVADVSENHKTYSDKDWEKKTIKYKQFSDEWYKKFKNDFTLKDEITIKANQVKFNYYRSLNQSTSIIKQLINSLNIQELKEQALFYINNDMKNDLQKMYEEAQKAGKEAEEVISEILKELNVQIEDLKK